MAQSKTIGVLGQEVTVPQPYDEGHTLTAIEAKVLNQTFAENISNNVRAKIKKAQDGGEGAPTMQDALASAQEYAAKYQFTEAAVGTGRSTLTPVEREARRLATIIIRGKLKEQNRKVGKGENDVSKEAFDGEVARVAQIDKIVRAAAKNVRDADNLAKQSFDEGPEEAADQAA